MSEAYVTPSFLFINSIIYFLIGVTILLYHLKEPIGEEHYSNYLEADHEPVVDRKLWDAVQAKFNEREERMRKCDPASGKRVHSFNGKIICGRCGGLMNRSTDTDYNGEKYKA